MAKTQNPVDTKLTGKKTRQQESSLMAEKLHDASAVKCSLVVSCKKKHTVTIQSISYIIGI